MIEAVGTGSAGIRAPRSIGHYSIRGRLGKGSMGVVYHAVDDRSGDSVALKVIASDLEGEDEIRARFFREAAVASRLRHRNIVPVLDSGEDDGRLYLAMELLTGCTLGEFLRQPESADLEVRLDVMIQVCQGLMVAHAAGIYHRDIKPGNLFISADHRLRILDFGIARLAGSSMTVTGYVLGTPDFMSPEQARGHDVDERSDVFSAAAVFYLMLTGRRPFAADDLPSVLTKVLREDPPPIPPDVAPSRLGAVVAKALAKDPAARHQNMAQLGCDLMRAADTVVDRAQRRAAEVRPGVETLRQLARATSDRRRELELPTGEWSDWDQLTERFPFLRRGPALLGRFPLRAAVVEALATDASGRLAALRDEAVTLEEAHAEWSKGRALLAAGDEGEAATRFAAARRRLPESPVIAAALDACAAAARLRHERQSQLTGLLRNAEEAAGRRDWDAVQRFAADLEQLVPGSTDAHRLRRVAGENLEADRRQRARVQAGREAAGVLAEARTLADQGRYDDAVARLDAHLMTHPGAPGVAELIAALRRQQQEIQARDQQRLESARLIDEARRALMAGDLDSAAAAAARAADQPAAPPEASDLLAQISDAIGQRDARAAQAGRLVDLLERAEQLVGSGKLQSAVAVLDQALEIEPRDARALALRQEAMRELDVRRRQIDAAELCMRQRRAAAPAVREAARALASGEFRRARSLAEVARAQGPDLPEVRALFADLDARTPPPSDDDTARITPAGGDEDTAKVLPVETSWRDRVGELRDRAVAIVRRWQAIGR